MNSWILSVFSTMKGSATIAFIFLGILLFYLIGIKIYKLNVKKWLTNLGNYFIRVISNFLKKRELQYHRDLAIGKINEKNSRVRFYRFLNNLIIDLELKSKGFTPYSFLFVVVSLTFIGSVTFSEVVFNNFIMGIMLFPIILIGVLCLLYTSANIRHDARIEAIIEAENIISNNIKDGVVVAIRNNINLINSLVRPQFIDFLDNIDHKNYHVKTALLELNNNLGSVADDFIKKCIVFEMEEEHGIAGMFQDVIEINNIKTELRNEMKRRFEDIMVDFISSIVLIAIFLGGVLYFYPDVRNFYLHNIIGQIVIGLDMLIIISVFVLITMLRAKEL